MADAIIQQGHLTQAEFDANPTLVLEDGQIVWLTGDSGTFKKGDGVTALSALPFLGNGNQTLAQVLANGNSTGNTDLTSSNTKKRVSINDSVVSSESLDNSGEGLRETLGTDSYSINDKVSRAQLFSIDRLTGSIKKGNDEIATINDIPTVPTKTSDLTNDGANGTNPFITALDLPNFEGLKSGGTITIVGNDIQVSAASWVVGTTYYNTSSTTTFASIALSSSGLQRYIGLYGTTSNTITKVDGSEAALATYPTTPANSIVIGYVLVNDASASSTPDLSGYLLKLDKATQSTNTTGTNDTTYVTPLANAIKLNKNTAITAATKTKITYDVKGLVTSGADATTADIADSTDKRYVTDANLTVIGNTSGTNSGDNATNSQYSGLAASKENAITATTASDFWSGAKTFVNFATTVRATVLTGLSLASSTVISATDSVLVAIGSLQAQISNRLIKSGDTISGDIANSSTGYFQLPSGTTAQRPGSPSNGMRRYNTDTSRDEFYANGSWQNHARLSGDTFTGAITTRITPRVTTITSSATPTINTDNCDCVTITALAAAITSMTTNLTGTPANFDKLIIRIKDNGTARAITWGASFEAKGISLPTTTTLSKVLTVGFIYDSVTAKWGCVASANEL